ncbi:S49 family peptidase [Gordonia polyisoprenivorans]|uniref:S49 family peptidase n=1 Tax=Gordonia polyisoprenivorans TaxID=84595 RepID=UPI001AD73677|nr:S49 family peptidase [Gordonia polyisoprenivorans]QTI69771.1 S49 family peptidase [Gordonia polyisoprenivorans]
MSRGPLGRIAKKLAHKRSDKVAVVRLDGVIGHGGPGRPGLSTTSVEPVLTRAFGIEHLRAVVIVINSPGGSPTQSEYIAERIRQLASEKGVRVLAFCEDVVASGGYWIACAADEIYAAHTSLVGSIGVVSSGFGFVDVLGRLGVERRLYSAGENKVRLDSFSPEKADDVEWLQGLQHQLHETFIRWVRQRRGKRLAADEDVLFTGDVWIGERAAELGLVDGIGVMRSVVAEHYPDAEITVVDAPKPLLARIVGDQVRASVVAEELIGGAVSALERASAVRLR